MAFPVERVLTALDQLRRADREGGLSFGANSHGYRLEPVLAEADVAAFETRHGIVLPADYREFVTCVGNGGAGPFYGVFRLGEMDDGFGHATWKPGEFVGAPSKPFPHRAAWNLSSEELEEVQSAEDDEEILRRYSLPVDGAIPLCHEGCALREWLVVTGPEAGRVWHDATADYGGWQPVTEPSGEHATFGAWYLRWLDTALAALSARK